jgi:hypothetical protein
VDQVNRHAVAELWKSVEPTVPIPCKNPMQEDKILTRRIFGQKWERVEYSLTSYGRTLGPVLTLMAKWGKTHRKSKEGKTAAALTGRFQVVTERSASHP